MKEDSRDIARAKAKLEEIRHAAPDDEKAHGLEDDFYMWTLKKVRAGHPQSQKLAGIALKTSSIEFARWMA